MTHPENSHALERMLRDADTESETYVPSYRSVLKEPTVFERPARCRDGRDSGLQLTYGG